MGVVPREEGVIQQGAVTSWSVRSPLGSVRSTVTVRSGVSRAASSETGTNQCSGESSERTPSPSYPMTAMS